ncbi:tRNA (cytidine(34)-2'-O)-methyltransferase [Thermodesulfobacteriota bacterium]
MPFNIVLVSPQIPNNTGNIGRLCVATNSVLHLVEPLGFDLTDKMIKRAGLKYWQYLEYYKYASLEAFMQAGADKNLIFFSSNALTPYWDCTFEEHDFLVFGREEDGFPADVLAANNKRLFAIPQYNQKVRSLNLSNAVSIVLYEALRQQTQAGNTGRSGS